MNAAILINRWECLTTLSDGAFSCKNAFRESVLEFTPLYTAAGQNKVLVLLLVLFAVRMLGEIPSGFKGLRREQQTWVDSGRVGHSRTAELEEVWLQSLLQIQTEQRLGVVASKPGWSHPSHRVRLQAARGSSVELRYTFEEGTQFSSQHEKVPFLLQYTRMVL